MKFQCFILTTLAIIFSCFSKAENVNSNEYYSDGKIRRTITYDEKLNIIAEQYFRKTNSKLIASIFYKSKEKLSRVTFFDDDGINKLFDIDFEKGKYVDTKQQIELNFRDNFIFEGKQIGNHIVANYVNNKRNGPVLQYDSTITGKVISNKVFAEYEYKIINDRIYIVHTTLHPMYDDIFSLYKGAFCNFKNDVLDKKSEIFTSSGGKKVEAIFNKGKCHSYKSYDKIGNTISRISCNNGLVDSKILLNGTVKEYTGNNIVWFYTLESIGEIYANYNPPHNYSIGANQIIDIVIKNENVWNCAPNMEVKREFDSLLSSAESITTIRKFLGIPNFHIRRFNFDNYDKDDIAFLHLNSITNIDSIGIHNARYNIKYSPDTLFYERSPFFTDISMQTDNLVNIDFWESTFKTVTHEDNTPKVNERNAAFNNWIKEAFNCKNVGFTDNMLSRNGNGDVREFLTSYADSLLKMCFSLYSSDTVPTFVNVFKENNSNSAYSCFNYNNYQMYDVGYFIQSKSERFVFYVKYERNKMFTILKDNIFNLNYQFERIYGGSVGDRDWEPWEFSILDIKKNKKLYSSKGEGNNRVSINQINNEVKTSLTEIYESFQ